MNNKHLIDEFRSSSESDNDIRNQETFSFRLCERRKKLRLTQRQLAKAVGVSVTTIQTYENNTIPKGGYLILLSDVLKCSIDWLLKGVGPEDLENKTTSASNVQTSARPGPGSLTAEYIPAEADELRPGGPVEGFGQAVEMLSDIFHSRDKVLIDTAISVLTTLSARCGRKPHHYNKEE